MMAAPSHALEFQQGEWSLNVDTTAQVARLPRPTRSAPEIGLQV